MGGIELTNDMKRIDQVRRDVGMGIPETSNLFPHLTVLENCTLSPVWIRKRPFREARETGRPLPRAGQDPPACRQIPGPDLRRPAASGWPSHGASAWSPEIILFDEPTSAPGPGDDQGGPGRHAGPRHLRHDHGLRHPRDGLRPGGRPIGSSSWMSAKSSRRPSRRPSSTGPEPIGPSYF